MQRAFSVWPLLLVLLGGAALAVCQWLIFFYAPVEAQLGLMQKVFYTHLPLAWWALISFLVVFVASIVYLIRRSPAADRVCAAAAEVGVLLAGLALVTGMIWARRSWGVWWTWDPRLTTTLVMWFIYAGYLVLRGLDLPPQRKRMICAVVGVVAFLDVPLVFLSARLWRSIHPAVFASKGGGLEPEMKLTAIACVAAMGLFWAGLVWLRTRQLGLRDRLDSLRKTDFRSPVCPVRRVRRDDGRGCAAPGERTGGAVLRPGSVSPVFNGYKRDPRFQGVPYGQQFPVAGGGRCRRLAGSGRVPGLHGLCPASSGCPSAPDGDPA